MNGPAPEPLAAELAAGDFDAAVRWLRDHPWPPGPAFLRTVDQVADVFLSVEPLTAASIMTKRLEQTNDPRDALEVRLGLIDAYCRAQSLGPAREVFDDARHSIEALDDEDERHTLLSNAASFFQRGGDLKLARDLLSAVLDQRRARDASGDTPASRRLTATALVNLATVEAHPASGQLDLALELLNEAESLTDTPMTLGNIAYNRGFVHVQRHDIAAAASAYGQAVGHFERAGSAPLDVAFVVRAQAALLARVGRVDEAANQYERAVQLFLDAAAFDEAARTDIGLLMARAVAGHDIEPERIEQSRRRLTEAAPADLPELLMNIANIEATTGKTKAASTTLVEARRLFDQLGRRVDVARADLSLAAMLRQLGQPEQALPLILQARDVLVAEDRSHLVAHADNNLALIRWDLGDPASATTSILSALTELDRRRHDLPSAHDRATTGSVTYPHLFDLALQITDRQPDLQAAIIERARVQPIPTPAADGHLRYAPPPPVAARPGSRAVPGVGRTRFLTEQLTGPSSAHRLSWALTNEQLLRCHITEQDTIIDHVPIDQALLESLRAAIAQPLSDEQQSSHDTAATQRAALYRAARGPLLADPQLAERLARTLPRSLRLLVDCVNHPSTNDLLNRLGQQLIPPSLQEQLSPNPVQIRLAPPPLLGHVPWAAILVNGRCLAEMASLEVLLPISLEQIDTGIATTPAPPGRARRRLWVADPTGDLHHCRRAPDHTWTYLSSHTTPPADRNHVTTALRAGPDIFVYRGHIEPGTPNEPASARLRLTAGTELRADQLVTERAPLSQCILLGCDASGGTTGAEWTGIATGFVWAGATEVITTQWPVVDRPSQERLDLELVETCLGQDLITGLNDWQRRSARNWRTGADTPPPPYQWANPIALRSRALVHNSQDSDLPGGDL